MDVGEEYWPIKSHHYHKYSILGKYLGACLVFQSRYGNFIYVETHGGSGLVHDVEKDELVPGSPIIARNNINEELPCYILEIREDRYKRLCESLEEYPNANPICGDCNNEISNVLDSLPKWKFKLCFLDPDGLVEDTTGRNQLTWDTVKYIGKSEKTEILLNFSLEALIRLQGHILELPDNPKSIKFKERIRAFMPPTDEWENKRNKRDLLEIYLKHLREFYPYIGAILVRTERRSPQYYLVYGTKNQTGAKIMRDVMKKEFFGAQKILGDFEELYPLNNFIFDD
jgi:three-Cys-motif partner protein